MKGSVRTVTGLRVPTVISTVRPHPHDLPAPLTEVAVKDRKAREVRDPEAQAGVGRKAPTSREPQVPKVFATTSSRVLASVARIAHSFTRRGPFPQEDKGPRRRSTRHASFGSLERAQKATSVGFSIKMLKRLLLQPRNRRPHLQHQSRDPQGLIPQLPSQEEEAQDQSREGNPTSLQLVPSRQRPREDLRMTLRILGRLISRVGG